MSHVITCWLKIINQSQSYKYSQRYCYKIMYNRVYNYFVENRLLFPKQFAFQINRNQCIVYDVQICLSKYAPQGSILGSLLFLIYVNDFLKCSGNLSPAMFADDTSLFISGIYVDDLFSDMNCELNKISLWFKANKLSLNLTKTKYSLFHPASKKDC